MTGRLGPHSMAWHRVRKDQDPILRPGTVMGLEDQEPRGGPGTMVSNVCMTGRPGPHATAWHETMLGLIGDRFTLDVDCL